LGVPAYITWSWGMGLKTFIFLALILCLPILGPFWWLTSEFAPRKNEKAKLPGKPIEHYLKFAKAEDRDAYFGKKQIPIETFQEKYFDGDIELNGDMLDILEWRHDWSKPRFTLGLIKHFLFGMIPEMIVHSKSQGRHSDKRLEIHILRLLQTKNRFATTTTAVTTSTAGSSVLA
jgi:hypothetical protein